MKVQVFSEKRYIESTKKLGLNPNCPNCGAKMDKDGDGLGMSNEVTPGRYRHFKGNEYTVLHTAKSTEDESEVVVYRAEYGTNQIWVRPMKQFCEKVCVDGKLVNRFERNPDGDDDYHAHEDAEAWNRRTDDNENRID